MVLKDILKHAVSYRLLTPQEHSRPFTERIWEAGNVVGLRQWFSISTEVNYMPELSAYFIHPTETFPYQFYDNAGQLVDDAYLLRKLIEQ